MAQKLFNSSQPDINSTKLWKQLNKDRFSLEKTRKKSLHCFGDSFI